MKRRLYLQYTASFCNFNELMLAIDEEINEVYKDFIQPSQTSIVGDALRVVSLSVENAVEKIIMEKQTIELKRQRIKEHYRAVAAMLNVLSDDEREVALSPYICRRTYRKYATILSRFVVERVADAEAVNDLTVLTVEEYDAMVDALEDDDLLDDYEKIERR